MRSLVQRPQFLQDHSTIVYEPLSLPSGRSKREDFDKALKFALCCIGKGDFTLKAKQVDAIKCIYDGKDVFLWLPTGFGRSICYETLPFFFFSTTSTVTVEQAVIVAYIVLVVSPLVSLMVDQVASLSEDTGTSNSTPMRLAQPCFFPSAVKVPNECFDCVSVGQR